MLVIYRKIGESINLYTDGELIATIHFTKGSLKPDGTLGRIKVAFDALPRVDIVRAEIDHRESQAEPL